jgi:hypothetical protein
MKLKPGGLELSECRPRVGRVAGNKKIRENPYK